MGNDTYTIISVVNMLFEFEVASLITEVIYPLFIFKFMEFKILETVALEHEELHKQLVKAIEQDGKVGEAATAVADVLYPHFKKEEEYELPPLGLLSSLLNQYKISPEMKNVLTMTERLRD
jgi:hypothetical protein